MKYVLPVLLCMGMSGFLHGQQTPSQQAMLAEFEEKWKNAGEYTLELLDAFPDSLLDFTPTEGEMTFRQQVLHIAGNMNWLASSYLGGTKMDEDLKKNDYTKPELRAILEKAIGISQTAAASLPLDKLDETVSFFAGPKTKRQILVLMNDHHTHHRGQLIVYLRLNGIKPPKYRGW